MQCPLRSCSRFSSVSVDRRVSCRRGFDRPAWLHLIPDVSQVHVLAEIGIVLLLFTIGMEFSSAHFAAARRTLMVAAPVQTGGVLILALLWGAGHGLSYQRGNFLGIPPRAQQHSDRLESPLRRRAKAIHFMAVPRDFDFPGPCRRADDADHADPGHTQRECDGDGADDAGEGGRRGRLIVAAAWYPGPRLLRHIVRSRRSCFCSIIVLCLGIAWLTSLGGLSLALGAFIAGLVMC